MYRTIQFSILFFCFLTLFSCSDKNNIEIPIPDDIIFIGHKGSGPINKNGNINLLENTWDAIANAMNKLDGSEIDIQMSADSTLWIFHDHKILNCEDSLINFFLCSDDLLQHINKCNYNGELIKLSSFISKSKAQDWENKTLSLDLKVLYNPEVTRLFPHQDKLLRFVGNKLQNILDDSKFDVLFEVYTALEYAYFDSIYNKKAYRVDYSPTLSSIREMNDSAIRLSLPIYELDDSLVKMGIKVENLWTINTANQFIKCLPFKPRLLESDNIPLMSFFRSYRREGQLECISSESYNVSLKDKEFYGFTTISLPVPKNILIKYESTNGTFTDDVLLTFSAFSEDGESKKWVGIKLSEFQDGYYFIDFRYLEHLGSTYVKIGLWNTKKENLYCKFKLSQYVLK